MYCEVTKFIKMEIIIVEEVRMRLIGVGAVRTRATEMGAVGDCSAPTIPLFYRF